MHLNHKPGEVMQVDWAGNTAAVIDTDTGEIIPPYVFVATLPYSGYSYVEAFFSMNQESWTAAHVNAYKYFGGVTRIIQCDNLKTGVQKHGKDEAVLNKSYQDLALLIKHTTTYKEPKPLIVTTNLTLEELQHPEDTAHARIYDRLIEMCSPVCITGKNFRKAKAREKMEQLKMLLNGKEICL